MPRILLTAVLTTAFIFAAAADARAWDDVGHRLTAYIAWQNMTPAARENAIRILRLAPGDSDIATFYVMYSPGPIEARNRAYFELIATWADIVRNFGMAPEGRRIFEDRYKKYHRGNWHYDDFFWKQVDGKAEIVDHPEDGGVAIKKLAEFDRVLLDPKADEEKKAIAIAWIMHIIGDIHQPLHTSGRITDLEPKGDQGGNLFVLSPANTPRNEQLNLHWFWDSIIPNMIPYGKEPCGQAYIESIGNRIMKKYPLKEVRGRLEPGEFEKWKRESFDLVPANVFTPDLKRNETPSAKYKRNALRVAEGQLAMAGYRLAETLNAGLGQPAAK